jgi:hypothetical protein
MRHRYGNLLAWLVGAMLVALATLFALVQTR